MRRLVLSVVLLALVIPAYASHRVTVEQLHSILLKQKGMGKDDEDIARQVGGLELTERLSPNRLNQFYAELQPGPKTTQALTLLGDVSAFLNLPPDDLPALSPPDLVSQQAILKAAVQHVVYNIQRLPNFFATRTTRSFDDSPPVLVDFGTSPLRSGIHFVSTVKEEITFRNGREELTGITSGHGSKQGQTSVPLGLNSWGEFGTLQAVVLSDATKGELKWSHWEHGDLGDEAVFQFSVPQSLSHYMVDYCCVRKDYGPDLDHPYIRKDDVLNKYKGTPAYHGELSIDPKTGAILRLSLQSQFTKSDPISRNDMAVQFGEVNIGGQSYICPIRSVAISSTLVGSSTTSATWEVLRINDASFENYHRFGSTAKILPGISQPN